MRVAFGCLYAFAALVLAYIFGPVVIAFVKLQNNFWIGVWNWTPPT